MTYSLVNVLAILVGIAFFWNARRIVGRGREDLALLALSIVLGGGLIFVAIFPNTFDVVATALGLEWKARAMLVLSNLTLFVVVTYLFDRLGRLGERVSRLNEELSLLEAELDERDD